MIWKCHHMSFRRNPIQQTVPLENNLDIILAPPFLTNCLVSLNHFPSISRLPVNIVASIFANSSQCNYGSFCITKRSNVILG
jgi:hypothetical protein